MSVYTNSFSSTPAEVQQYVQALQDLADEDKPQITGYDQDLWADRLGYDAADVAIALEQFRAMRNANLRLLRRVKDADLERSGVHSERGQESVAQLMRLYAGHDRLHLCQIKRIRASI